MLLCILATAAATLAALPVALAMVEVYPRIYDPLRVWRKRRMKPHEHTSSKWTAGETGAARTIEATSTQRQQPHTHTTTTTTSISALAVEAASTSPSPEPLSGDSSPEPAHVSISSFSSSGASMASGLSEPSSPSPSSTNLRNRKRSPLTIVEPSSCSGETSDFGDPSASPMASLAPPSLANFRGLLRAHLRQCLDTLRALPRLQSLIVVCAMLYGFGEPVHRLRGVFLAAHGVPAAQLGVLGATMFALSSLGSFVSARVRAIARTRLGLGALGVVVLSSALSPLLQWTAASLVGPGLGAPLLLLPASFLWGVRLPLLSHFLHRQLPHSNQRATVASCQSLANKLALVRTNTHTHAQRTRLV